MNEQELLKLMAQYAPINIEMNDQAYSKLFGDIFKSELRYNATTKGWFFYDGKRWREDVGGLVAAAKARKFSDVLNLYATTIREKYIGQPQEGESPEEKEKREQRESKWKKFAAYAWGFYDARERETLVKDARTVLRVLQEEFDQNINLFNCQNCTLDFSELPKIKKHSHSPADMLTKICGCDYVSDADCAKWEKFIDEVMQGDKDKATYLRRICGYTLQGKPTLEKMFILYGASTRNGKSTFVESFRAMMGDYAGVMQPESLATIKNKDGSAATPDIAKLAGKRFTSVPEPAKNMPLNVELVKRLTGKDTIEARKLYENTFEFRPQYVFFMHCNSLPVVADNTLFDSERVRILEFNRHFEEHEQNQNLKEELQAPEVLSSVLLWALVGLKDFKKNGERPPQSVKMATAMYKQQSDKISMFFRDCMTKEQGKNTAAADAYNVYARWCMDESRGYSVEGKQKFLRALRNHGLLQEKATINGNTVKNVIVGYTISTEWEEEEKPPFP